MLKSKLGLATAGVLAATLSMQSMAQEVAVSTPLSVDELSFAFADVAQADVLAMSQGEMKETEGAVAFVPFLIGMMVGGATGVGMHQGFHNVNLYRQNQPPQFDRNIRNNAFAFGTGMVGGAYTTSMLRAASIPTSIVSPIAWNSANATGNTIIRANGAAIGQAHVAVYNRPVNAQLVVIPTNPVVVRPTNTITPPIVRPYVDNSQLQSDIRLNQQMLNQSIYSGFVAPRFCPSYTGSGMGMNICG